ncbi:MAG: NYN domain-containing protein, partial [Candidatus Methanomethylophilus sp.]|nr:NYN domain-containing protein [Methanomethylophilus sp.]
VIVPKGSCGNSSKQIGVDVQLATDVVTSAIRSSCDTIVIVSGDGDFIPVIDCVKASGKKIEFAAFSGFANMSLIEETDYFTYLDDLPICREVDA